MEGWGGRYIRELGAALVGVGSHRDTYSKSRDISFNMKSLILSLVTLASTASAHYTFPELIAGGKGTGQWVNVRKTANYQSNGTSIPPFTRTNHIS